MANFLPRGESMVSVGADGRVKGIIASCMGKPVLFQIVNNKPRRRATKDIPFFSIPPVIYGQLTSQLTRVIADRQAEAEKFASIKKEGEIFMPERRPFDVLNSALNNTVIIGMKGGTEFRGVMVAYDVHMNIVLEKAEQMVNGEVKRGVGTVLLRGDSVTFISPS